MKKNILTIILAVAVAVLTVLLIDQKNQTTTITTIKYDTITEKVTDTLEIVRPSPAKLIAKNTIRDTLPIYISKTDTIYEAVEVPVLTQQFEGKQTKDSCEVDYSITATGYKLSLDSINFRVTYPKQTITKIEEKTIPAKKRILTISPSVGFGYGLTTKKPDIYVGLSLNVNIF